LSETFLTLSRIQRHININVHRSSREVPVTKLDLSRTYLRKKYVNTKFHKNPSSGSQVIPRERTEGQPNDEADSRYSLSVISRNRLKADSYLVPFQNFSNLNINY